MSHGERGSNQNELSNWKLHLNLTLYSNLRHCTLAQGYAACGREPSSPRPTPFSQVHANEDHLQQAEFLL